MAVATEESSQTSTVHLELNYCDACSAALGRYRVWIDRYAVTEDGFKSLDLVFCAHHFKKSESAILASGYEVEEL